MAKKTTKSALDVPMKVVPGTNIFRTQFDPEYNGSEGESNMVNTYQRDKDGNLEYDEQGFPIITGRAPLQSKTEPGQHMTIQQLVENATNGIKIPPLRKGIYTGNAEIPIIRDILDVQEYAESNQLDLETAIAEAEQEAEKREAAAKEKHEQERSKEVKNEEPPTPQPD